MSPEWHSVPISEVCELIIDCVNKTAPVIDSPTPYKMIRTTNVRDGWVDTMNARYVDEETYKKWTRRGEPKNGDVILTREAPLGEVGLLRDAKGIFLGQRLVMYRANPAKLDNRFLLYSLLGHDLQAQIKAFGSGSTVEHMRVPDCEKLILEIPPIETQQKIGSILSAYDDLIENNSRRIKILEEMVRMIYREWFVNFRFPGHEQVKMVDSPLGMIPEGWEVGKLQDYIELCYGKALKAEDRNDGPYPVYGSSGVVGFHSENLVYLAGNNCGARKAMLAVFAGPMNRSFRLIPSITSKLTCLSTMSSIICSKQNFINNDAAVPGLNRNQAYSLPFILPTKSQLKAFDEFIEPIFNTVRNLTKKNQNLRQTRDLLLPKLISGEVAV